jgi:hypothetical protein
MPGSVLHALKLDPKIAAGPVTLAFTDIFTLFFYFGMAPGFCNWRNHCITEKAGRLPVSHAIAEHFANPDILENDICVTNFREGCPGLNVLVGAGNSCAEL